MAQFISGEEEQSWVDKCKKFFQYLGPHKTFGLLSTLFVILALPLAMYGSLTKQNMNQKAAAAGGPFHFVSNAVTRNGNGENWDTAWKELDNIQWDSIKPGDTILIDGGTTSLTYRSSLKIQKSNIVIRMPYATESGGVKRDGQVIIFGGRISPLPDGCILPASYNPVIEDGGTRAFGIDFNGQTNVVVNGLHWRGIDIHGHGTQGYKDGSGTHYGEGSGVKLSGSNNTLKYAEVYDNGTFWNFEKDYDCRDFNSDVIVWRTDGPGINIITSTELGINRNNTVDHVIDHDNGQDPMQSGGFNDLHVNRSWFYNGRTNQLAPKEPSNYNTHSDGTQLFGEGHWSGYTINQSIFGPGLMQGLILGENTNHQSVIDNVSISDSLFIGHDGKSINAAVITKDLPPSPTDVPRLPLNWKIDHVTSVRPHFNRKFDAQCNLISQDNYNWHNFYVHGYNHSVTNSIFVGGNDSQVGLGGNTPVAANNCVYDLVDQCNHPHYNFTAKNANPGFAKNYSSVGDSSFDFSLPAGSPCQGMGTSITSVAALMGDSPVNTPTPTISTTPSVTPSPTPSSKHWKSSVNFQPINLGINNKSGIWKIEFDVTPSQGLTDGVIGYTKYNAKVMDYKNLGFIVRMKNGYFDVSNGTGYGSDYQVAYAGNKKYHLTLFVDIRQKKQVYDVLVKSPDEQIERTIASGYKFRNTTPNIGAVYLKALTDKDSFVVDNHKLKFYAPTPTLTPTPTISSFNSSVICSGPSNKQCSYTSNCSTNGAICQCADSTTSNKQYKCQSGTWQYQTNTSSICNTPCNR